MEEYSCEELYYEYCYLTFDKKSIEEDMKKEEDEKWANEFLSSDLEGLEKQLSDDIVDEVHHKFEEVF